MHLAAVLSLPLASDTRAQAPAHVVAQGALKGMFSIILIVELVYLISFLLNADHDAKTKFWATQWELFDSRIVVLLFTVLFLALLCCKPVDKDEQVLAFVTGQISLPPLYQAFLAAL